MARARAKYSKAAAPTMLLDAAAFLGPDPFDGPDDDALRVYWLEHRDRLLALEPAGQRPWAFWRFEAEVPDELRGDRPQLLDVDDREAVATYERERLDLAARRAAWLTGAT